MKVRAALLREVPCKWVVNEVELGGPREGAVLVKITANGLCHSDDRYRIGAHI